MCNVDSFYSKQESFIKRASKKGSSSSRLDKCKLAIALVAFTLIAQLFTASTASAYSCKYGIVNPVDNATVLLVNLEIDGVELDVVQPLHPVGNPDKYGRRTKVRKIYQMRDYTERFPINVSYSTVPYTKWKNMHLTDKPIYMVIPSSYNASSGGVAVRAKTRSLWDKFIKENGGPHSWDHLIDPLFNRQFGVGNVSNYDYIPDPSVLPTDINPGPFEFSLNIYNPIHWDKHHEAAMLNISVSQGFELLELIWDERFQRFNRTHMDIAGPIFTLELWVIVPDPGDAPLIPTKIFPENGSTCFGSGEDSRITFSWNTSSNADRYQARFRAFGDTQWNYSPDNLATTHAIALGFPNDGTRYEWSVRAGNSAGQWSNWSSPWTFTNGYYKDMDNGDKSLEELPEMLTIGARGFTIDYTRDHRVEAGAAIGTALQVDSGNLFLWMGGTLFNIRSQAYDAPVDITWVINNLEGYWDGAGNWVDW